MVVYKVNGACIVYHLHIVYSAYVQTVYNPYSLHIVYNACIVDNADNVYSAACETSAAHTFTLTSSVGSPKVSSCILVQNGCHK